MILMGETSPSSVLSYTVIVALLKLFTNISLLSVSTNISSGPRSPVFGPPMVLMGETSPSSLLLYTVTVSFSKLVINISLFPVSTKIPKGLKSSVFAPTLLIGVALPLALASKTEILFPKTLATNILRLLEVLGGVGVGGEESPFPPPLQPSTKIRGDKIETKKTTMKTFLKFTFKKFDFITSSSSIQFNTNCL